MPTIADRIRQVLADQGIKPSTLETGRNRTHLTRYLRVVDVTGDDGGITLSTLRDFAAALKVPLAWLLTGDGEAPILSRRQIAAGLARELGVADEVIEEVLRIYPDDPTKPTLWWTDKMRLRHATLLARLAPRDYPDPMQTQELAVTPVARQVRVPSDTPAAGTLPVSRAPTSSKRRPRER